MTDIHDRDMEVEDILPEDVSIDDFGGFVKLVDLAEMIPYKNNPKDHDEEQVKNLASAFINEKFDVPIVLDANMEIIKGHARYQALQFLGIECAPAIVRNDQEGLQAASNRIGDNKLAESPWDNELLAVELEQLQEEDNSVSSDDETANEVRQQ